LDPLAAVISSRARDTDLGLIPVVISHAHRAEHSARGRRFNTVGDGAGTGLHIRCGHSPGVYRRRTDTALGVGNYRFSANSVRKSAIS
jgi:hypothetical protein